MADPATDSSQNVENSEVAPPARIVVIGTGWWGQGWHLPHLHRNPNSVVAAIVDTNPNPTASSSGCNQTCNEQK
jgi:S-adenosylmethionine:diacylglycerol 3-amino-3-carboxypropyl transferase